jgi:hypothetical protein
MCHFDMLPVMEIGFCLSKFKFPKNLSKCLETGAVTVDMKVAVGSVCVCMCLYTVCMYVGMCVPVCMYVYVCADD